MNLFSKENQITPTVWNFKNFIDVNFFDDYIEVLKQTYNGNNSIDWVINNCDLNGLQDIVDTSFLLLSYNKLFPSLHDQNLHLPYEKNIMHLMKKWIQLIIHGANH